MYSPLAVMGKEKTKVYIRIKMAAVAVQRAPKMNTGYILLLALLAYTNDVNLKSTFHLTGQADYDDTFRTRMNPPFNKALLRFS